MAKFILGGVLILAAVIGCAGTQPGTRPAESGVPGVGEKAAETPLLTEPRRMIPRLEWEERSDWVNVKTLGAKGDGIADDTAAIQKAFDQLTDVDEVPVSQRRRVVYLPAGQYRITQTLTITKSTGAWIVGQGRDTVLCWDGAEGGRMYWSNGVEYARYEGLTWDGKNKAAMGVEHLSMHYYETSLRYENCAFLNCREQGVMVGRGTEKVATAEMWFKNCVFENCKEGVSYQNYNDYDNSFDGCEFVNCGIGINSERGNFYVRTCHFFKSKMVDVRQGAPSHASSLRFCTSRGSRRFFETGVGVHLSMKIQDCQVANWTGKEGAIVLGHRGPTTVFDCAFTAPPGPTSPIRLVNPKGIQQLLVISNNTSPETPAVVEPGPNSRITELAKGERGVCLKSAQQRFLVETAVRCGKIFDVKRDFGAKGDGRGDDTPALQKAIDTARTEGHGAIVYLPYGEFRITQPLQVTGGGYAIIGTGFMTKLNWAGAKNGEMMQVVNPQGVTIAHFDMSGANSATRIHQTGDSGASSVYYDGVYTNSCDEASTMTRGLWCENLSQKSLVRIGHFIGNIRLTDCGEAKVLSIIHYYSLLLEGTQKAKTGLAGFMMHNDACHIYALEVMDNQDVVVADFYSESNRRYLLCTGGERKGKGRVTIGASKLCPTENECITIKNYEGRIFVGGGDSYNQTHWGEALNIVHEGTRPVDFVIAGHAWWAVPPRMTVGPGMRYGSIENLLVENKYPEYAEKSLPNEGGAPAQKAATAALDDFRELGQAYLKYLVPPSK